MLSYKHEQRGGNKAWWWERRGDVARPRRTAGDTRAWVDSHHCPADLWSVIPEQRRLVATDQG